MCHQSIVSLLTVSHFAIKYDFVPPIKGALCFGFTGLKRIVKTDLDRQQIDHFAIRRNN